MCSVHIEHREEDKLGENISMITGTISHDRADETPEAKARWFSSLSLSERMELLCSFTDLILAINPRIADLKDAQQTKRRVQILSEP